MQIAKSIAQLSYGLGDWYCETCGTWVQDVDSHRCNLPNVNFCNKRYTASCCLDYNRSINIDAQEA